jgi:hypothetical protein
VTRDGARESGKRDKKKIQTRMDEIRHAAATKIQARARGMIDRKKVREKRRRHGGRRRPSSAKAQGVAACLQRVHTFARAAATPAERATLHSHNRAVRRRVLSRTSAHVAGTTRSFRGEMTRAEEEMEAPWGRKTCSHAP